MNYRLFAAEWQKANKNGQIFPEEYIFYVTKEEADSEASGSYSQLAINRAREAFYRNCPSDFSIRQLLSLYQVVKKIQKITPKNQKNDILYKRKKIHDFTKE
ncbi:MAG: hypothetical protein V1928_02045 [Parcubacteria group bacterium]